MPNCLAATGVDPVLPLLLAAVLVVGGAALAVFALRRRHARGAAMALLAPLLLGALVLGLAPSPAHAAASSSCSSSAPSVPTPTPTPVCTPRTAFPDLTLTGTAWVPGTDVPNSEDLALDSASATSWESTQASIQALSSAGPQNATLTGHQVVNNVEFGYTGTTEAPNHAFYVHAADFTTAVTGVPGNTTIAVTLAFDLSYPNGCGGTLTTHITASGSYTAPPVIT